ncbi:MAG: MFS transporter [Halobacteriovoraceae bacterium]|nr:MFS transporter [Halobacteriovoraceae bacterium]
MKTLTISRTLLNLFFFTPYVVIFAQKIGLDIKEIMLIESLFAILIVFFDVPMGHFADKIGPKNALFLGAFSQSLASFLIFLFPTPIFFTMVQILFAFALCISRGADSAMIYLMLKDQNHESKFEFLESKYLRSLLFFEALVFFFSGLIASYQVSYVFLATGIIHFLSVLLILFLPNIKTQTKHGNTSLLKKYIMIKNGLVQCQKKIGFSLSIFFIGNVFSSLLYLIPLILKINGFSDYQIGPFFAITGLIASIVGYILRKYESKFFFPYIISLAGILGLYSKFYFILALAVVLLKWSQTVLMPKFKNEMVLILGDLGESTAMSVVTTLFTLGLAIIGPFWGALVDTFGINILMAILTFNLILSVLFMRFSKNAKGIKNVSA